MVDSVCKRVNGRMPSLLQERLNSIHRFPAGFVTAQCGTNGFTGFAFSQKRLRLQLTSGTGKRNIVRPVLGWLCSFVHAVRGHVPRFRHSVCAWFGWLLAI